MAGNILTPKSIWGNFVIDGAVTAQIKNEREENGLLITDLYLDGRNTADGQVKIFATFIKKNKTSPSSAILLVQDFEENDENALPMDLAEQGYAVLSVKLDGHREGAEDYTVYPDSISYANYEQVKDSLYIVKDDAIHTCWYEWAVAIRYALKYLRDQASLKKIGGMALGEVATALWQVAGVDKFDCTVFALNAGWAGYRGSYKFAGTVEPQFSDNMYKYIAGIEPQTYAMHVDSPVLVLAPTNSNVYDCDRAYDTVSHTKAEVYGAVHYSVGFRDRVSSIAYNNAKIFFNHYLNGAKSVLAGEMDIKCDVVDGRLQVEVTPDTKDLKELILFVAEEQANPALRTWVQETSSIKDGETYTFTYEPYSESGMVVMFAQATYKNGWTMGSNVIAKRFTAEEVNNSHKMTIIYSSRYKNSHRVFGAAKQAGVNSRINLTDKSRVCVQKGPMNIDGVTSKWGLITFEPSIKKYHPQEGAMLMLEVYAKEQAVLTVKLVADYFGDKVEYMASVKVLGGDVWYNVQIEINKFKTAEGMSLKSYDKIQAMEINVEGSDYLINNALWV